MNSKRAGNRRIAHREAEHNEKGYKGSNTAHQSHGSPASVGASIGPGPMPGAGQMPNRGPGAAAGRYAQRDPSESPVRPVPPGTAPKGMKTYNQE